MVHIKNWLYSGLESKFQQIWNDWYDRITLSYHNVTKPEIYDKNISRNTRSS